MSDSEGKHQKGIDVKRDEYGVNQKKYIGCLSFSTFTSNPHAEIIQSDSLFNEKRVFVMPHTIV